MAALTLYATNNLVSVHQELSATSPGANATSSPNVGWTVGTGSTNRAAFQAGTEVASTAFVNTTPPDGSIDTTNGDCLRSSIAYTGSFTSANWTISFTVIGVTQSGAQDGRAYFRLFRSANADGSSATEITGAAQQGSLVTNLSTTQQTSSVTFNPGAFSLTNEYLFVQVAWERTGAGGMTTTDVIMRVGTTATLVVTSSFSGTYSAGADDAVTVTDSVVATDFPVLAGFPLTSLWMGDHTFAIPWVGRASDGGTSSGRNLATASADPTSGGPYHTRRSFVFSNSSPKRLDAKTSGGTALNTGNLFGTGSWSGGLLFKAVDPGSGAPGQYVLYDSNDDFYVNLLHSGGLAFITVRYFGTAGVQSISLTASYAQWLFLHFRYDASASAGQQLQAGVNGTWTTPAAGSAFSAATGNVIMGSNSSTLAGFDGEVLGFFTSTNVLSDANFTSIKSELAWQFGLTLGGSSGTTIDVTVDDTAISVSDTVSKSSTYGRSPSDAIVVTDSPVRELSYGRSGNDSVLVTDVGTTEKFFGRSVSDAIVIIDATAKSLEYGRSISDTGSVSDTADAAVTGSGGAPDVVDVLGADCVKYYETYSLGTWTDTVGGVNATQATSGRQPAVGTTAGGNTYPSYDGGDQLQSGVLSSLPTWDTAHSVVWGCRVTRTGTDPMWLYGIDSYNLYTTDTANIAGIISSDTINDGNPHNIICKRDGTTGQTSLYIDGVLQNTPSADITTFGDSWKTSTSQTYGERPGGDYPFLGDIKAMFWGYRTGSTFTSGEITSLNDALDAFETGGGSSGTTYDIVLPDDTVSVSDSATTASDKSRVSSDAAVVADTATPSLDKSRVSSDAAVVTDTAAPSLDKSRATSDAVVVTDALTVNAEKSATVSDSVSVTDAGSKNLEYGRSISDAAVVTDAGTKSLEFASTVQDAIVVSDQASSGFEQARVIDDTASVGDQASRVMNFERSVNESIIVTEQVVRETSYARLSSDTVVLTDSGSGGLEFARAPADSVATTDSAATTRNVERSTTDAIAVSDAGTRSLETSRVVQDSAVVTDQATRQAAYVRSIIDSVIVTDDAFFDIAGVVTVVINDAIDVTDLVATMRDMTRTSADAAVVTDSASASRDVSRAVTDTAVVSDQSTWTRERSRTASDAVSVTDVGTPSVVFARFVDETIVITDLVAKEIVFQRSATDAVIVSDLLTYLSQSIIESSVDDSVSVTDHVAASRELARTALDAVAVIDTAVRELLLERGTDDDAFVIDSLLTESTYVRTIFDAISVLDEVSSDAIQLPVALLRVGAGTLRIFRSQSQTLIRVEPSGSRIVRSHAKVVIDQTSYASAVIKKGTP